MTIYRTRIGVKAWLAYVGLFALLFWAMRVSRESQPHRRFAGWLADGDVSRRLQAAQELRDLRAEPDVVVPALVSSLRFDGVASVREQSAVSLAALVSALKDGARTAEVADALVQALEDKDPGVRAAAAAGLGRIGPAPEAVVPGLLRATGDKSERVRGATVMALGLVERKAGVDRADVRAAIAAAMNDSSVHMREMGGYAFLAVAEKSPGLSIAFLKDEDVRTRRSAVAALARSSTAASAVIAELTAALTDEDATVRKGAEWSLNNIGPYAWSPFSPRPSPR